MRVPFVGFLLKTSIKRTIPYAIPFSYMIQEIKNHQVEQVKLLPENNIVARLTDGSTQNSIFPTDSSLTQLLVENNIPFAVEPKQPDVLGTIANLAVPSFLLFCFEQPKIMF